METSYLQTSPVFILIPAVSSLLIIIVRHVVRMWLIGTIWGSAVSDRGWRCFFFRAYCQNNHGDKVVDWTQRESSNLIPAAADRTGWRCFICCCCRTRVAGWSAALGPGPICSRSVADQLRSNRGHAGDGPASPAGRATCRLSRGCYILFCKGNSTSSNVSIIKISYLFWIYTNLFGLKRSCSC